MILFQSFYSSDVYEKYLKFFIHKKNIYIFEILHILIPQEEKLIIIKEHKKKM